MSESKRKGSWDDGYAFGYGCLGRVCLPIRGRSLHRHRQQAGAMAEHSRLDVSIHLFPYGPAVVFRNRSGVPILVLLGITQIKKTKTMSEECPYCHEGIAEEILSEHYNSVMCEEFSFDCPHCGRHLEACGETITAFTIYDPPKELTTYPTCKVLWLCEICGTTFITPKCPCCFGVSTL